MPPRDAICLELPGGSGFGDPLRITAEEARRDYRVAIDAQGQLDLAETERLRAL